MPDRADAHAHLFKPGFISGLGEARRMVVPEEVDLYEALAERHSVRRLLAIGYEGEPAYRGNNDYLAQIAQNRPWVWPVAFLEPAELTLARLQPLRDRRFVGISLYLFDADRCDALGRVPDAVWGWMVQHLWLISANSTKQWWTAWRPVLERHPELRLLVSHLGLPDTEADPARAMKPVTALSRFPNVRVKLSGFYALTTPGHDYPHERAWPLVQQLLESFGPGRLLWGSDFSPSLEFVTFPQTLDLFAKMPFLTAADRERIEGGNLLQLLDEVIRV